MRTSSTPPWCARTLSSVSIKPLRASSPMLSRLETHVLLSGLDTVRNPTTRHVIHDACLVSSGNPPLAILGHAAATSSAGRPSRCDEWIFLSSLLLTTGVTCSNFLQVLTPISGNPEGFQCSVCRFPKPLIAEAADEHLLTHHDITVYVSLETFNFLFR